MGPDTVAAVLWAVFLGFLGGMSFVRLWPEDRHDINLRMDTNVSIVLLCVAGLLTLCVLRGGR